jgi:hypothetical protein
MPASLGVVMSNALLLGREGRVAHVEFLKTKTDVERIAESKLWRA